MIDPRVGGPQIRSLAVALELRDAGVETEFLLPDGDDEFADRARDAGFTVHRPGLSRLEPPSKVVNNVRYSLEFPLAIRRIRDIIEDRSIDVVHANMSMNVDAALATRLSSASLVWHFNDVLVNRVIASGTSRLAGLLADRIVVASRSVAEHYFGECSQEMDVVYAPVDVAEFHPEKFSDTGVRAEFGLNEDTTLVGTVGNVNPVKGHEYLVRAANSLKTDTEGDVAVLIVGGTLNSRQEYYERLQSLCEQSEVEDVVQFVGRRSDVARMLSAFDVFVLPSVAEACPIAVLEAMSMEKPIVATDVGGIPEQIDDGESGWLVPPENPDAIADAVLEAIQDTNEAVRRGANARKKAVEKFSLERTAERTLNVYRKASSDG